MAAEAQVHRDNDFYFSFRTFKVEDALFRVPRHLFFMPNAKFQPVPQNEDTGDDLVELGEEIKKDDFFQLLRAVYPREYGNPETLTSAQWQTVFKLSKTFGMDDLQQKAARNLKDIFFAGDPVEALVCAQENKLDDWTEPLIEKIVERKRDLTEDELGKVGVPMAMKIAWAMGAAGVASPTGSFAPLMPETPKGKKNRRGKR